ncbi:MAG TPA: FlgD immunoglobulin-like domain containing protein [Ignavibacteriaceae bacterium]|nr:MAG: Xyloglucanase precursor [Ignavibacteria bacterium ADurb.Bin266]HQI41819.1 FlgD immunoglobulin-like domain containing protein [Ignavibacteriaceae bacterium]
MINFKDTLLVFFILSLNSFAQTWWTGGITENSLGHIFVGAINTFDCTNKVLISTDAGENWVFLDYGSGECFYPDFLAVDSKDYVYVAGIVSAFHRSTNGGVSWEFLGYWDNRSFHITDNDYIYMGLDDQPPYYIARSTDSGITWQDKTGSITTVIYALTSKGAKIYAGGRDGHFYISSDYGDTWNATSMFTQYYINQVFVNDSGHIFAGTLGDGVYISKDNGVTWQKTFNSDGYITSIVESDNGYLFTVIYNYGVFRSSDNGATWINKVNGLPRKPGFQKLFIASDNSIYLTTDKGYGIYKSTDYGDNWFHVGIISDVTDNNFELSTEYSLYQNYPNPFNPSTKIKYSIPSATLRPRITGQAAQSDNWVTLKVYDVLGNEVATLVNEYKPAGNYEVEFNGHSDKGQDLSSGVYFYTLRAGNFVQTKKMILLR